MFDLADSFQISLPPDWRDQIPVGVLPDDDARMSFVVDLARWNIRNATGGPFAAAVFERRTGRLVSVGVNRVVPACCSLAHAEAIAIALAQKSLGKHDLADVKGTSFELFASGQPCVQCFGMVWWSGISRLVIAARSEDIESLTGFREGPLPENWERLLGSRHPLPPVEVVTDVCRESACNVLSQYSAMGGTNYSPGQNDSG